MIKKSLIVFVILLSAYIYYREVMTPGMILINVHHSRKSVLEMEKYLFTKEKMTPENAIVGSSMSEYFVMDSLPDFENFAYSGETAYPGLEMLVKRGELPKRVFIETNTLYRVDDESTPINQVLFNPVKYTLNEYIPIMRIGREPMGVVSLFTKKYITNNVFPNNVGTEDDAPNKNNKIDSIMKGSIRKRYENVYLNPLAKNNGEEMAKRLKKYFDTFDKNRVEVVFYETPVDEDFQRGEMLRQTREVLKNNFPKYHYILPPKENFITLDGIHLNVEDRMTYTLYLKDKADSMACGAQFH